MDFYRKGRGEGGFEAGITTALSAVTNPSSCSAWKAIQRVAANGVYRIGDLELASRLSFFLWSSIPDDELLDAAVRGKLSQPGAREAGAQMLADRRSFNPRRISPDSGCGCAILTPSLQAPIFFGTR
jgi:hypothetical protein